jgi:hypothetical protein
MYNIIIIFIILVVLYFLLKRKSSFLQVRDVNDTCILLTMCVNVRDNSGYTPEQRLNIYLEVVDLWLKNTTFDLYIVESSGYTFPEINDPRVKVYSFISQKKYNCKRCYATPYEAESILLAFDALNLGRYQKIIKVTGKYFLPNFEKIVDGIPEDAQLYFQHNQSEGGQNSELFGCKTIYLKGIMNLILQNSYNNMNFESTLYSIRNDYIVYRFPKIKLNKIVKRGDGDYLKYL